jgi:ribonuclease BN (tRNA processing enzyme)
MQLQFVGCGDAFGSGGRFNTCFHLVGRGINALIDCGATSLVSMNKLAINRTDIDVIFVTHFHEDHIGALPFLILESNYVLKRQRPLTIVGPPSL